MKPITRTRNDETEFLFREETYALRGAMFEVYRVAGSGLAEAVYQECLELELAARQIPFVAQPELKLTYKGQLLRQTYRPDLVCYEHIIVELKAIAELDDVHRAQVFNYLKISDLKLGLLANFGHRPQMEIERYVVSAGKMP